MSTAILVAFALVAFVAAAFLLGPALDVQLRHKGGYQPTGKGLSRVRKGGHNPSPAGRRPPPSPPGPGVPVVEREAQAYLHLRAAERHWDAITLEMADGRARFEADYPLRNEMERCTPSSNSEAGPPTQRQPSQPSIARDIDSRLLVPINCETCGMSMGRPIPMTGKASCCGCGKVGVIAEGARSGGRAGCSHHGKVERT